MVAGDGAHGCAEVGHLEAREGRVLLHVDGVGPVQAHRRVAGEVHRVAEGEHLVAADGGGGADARGGDVAVGDRGGEVAAGHDRDRGVGGAGAAGRHRVHVADAERLGELVATGRGGQAGDPEGQAQTGEAARDLGGRGGAGGDDALRHRPGQGDPSGGSGPAGRRRGEQVLHLGGGGDAGDLGGARGQAVGDRADQAAVRGVDRGAAHALPDADVGDVGRRHVDHDHRQARRDAVLDDTEDLAAELLGVCALGDGQARHRLVADELVHREGGGAGGVGSRLCGCGREAGDRECDRGGRRGCRHPARLASAREGRDEAGHGSPSLREAAMATTHGRILSCRGVRAWPNAQVGPSIGVTFG